MENNDEEKFETLQTPHGEKTSVNVPDSDELTIEEFTQLLKDKKIKYKEGKPEEWFGILEEKGGTLTKEGISEFTDRQWEVQICLPAGVENVLKKWASPQAQLPQNLVYAGPQAAPSEVTPDSPLVTKSYLNRIISDLIVKVDRTYDMAISALSLHTSFSPSTMAQRYELRKKVMIKPWWPASKKKGLNGTRGIFKPNAIRAGASETNVVQPYWSNTILPQLQGLNLNVELQDMHGTPTIGTRKPDLPGYLRGKPTSIFHLAVVGEVKGSRNDTQEFTKEEKGQMDSFLMELLYYQPQRVFATGFLTDGQIIQFFRLEKKGTTAVYELGETEVYLLSDAASLFIGLLEADAASLDVAFDIRVGGQDVEIKDVLGVGATAVVYKGSHSGREVVLKVFRPEQAHYLAKEVEIHKMVASLGPSVTHYEAVSDDERTLLLNPVGIHFAVAVQDYLKADRVLANSQHFADLIDILQALHKLGLVHRDIKLSNFFQRDDQPTGVLLNDWTCAAPIGLTTKFEGALTHAPHEVLSVLVKDKGATYQPQPWHDLEMVVKCVFQRLCSSTFFEVQSTKIDDPVGLEKLEKFWLLHLSPRGWDNLLQAARKCEYNDLKNLIATFLPA